VDAGTGSLPPIGAIVVEVVVTAVVGAVGTGTCRGRYDLGTGATAGGGTVGGGTVEATVTGTVVAGLVMGGAVAGDVRRVRVVRVVPDVVWVTWDTTVAAKTGFGRDRDAEGPGPRTATTRIIPAADPTAMLSAVTSQRGTPPV
jgi:hypothetical protein